MGKLSRLFRWHRKVEIREGDKVLDTVYVRLGGDAEFQEAKNAALKCSKQLRTLLRDRESNEHQSNFSDLGSLTKNELVMGITFGEIPDYRDEGLLTLPERELPELPDNPTLEQQEEHESKLEELHAERAKALTEFIEKRAEERKKEIGEVEDIEQLREMYVHSVINMKCSEEFTRAFREYQVYRGTFMDRKFEVPAFDDFDDFDGCAPQLKNQLISAYVSLEMTGEDLKN